MSDEEVEVWSNKLSIAKLEERDPQEVAGYFEAMDAIAENYTNIDITESSIKNLHNIYAGANEKKMPGTGEIIKNTATLSKLPVSPEKSS